MDYIPLYQPIPATLYDFVRAIHAFELMRVAEIHNLAWRSNVQPS